MSPHARLAAEDRRLADAGVEFRSLSPAREEATPLAELGERLLGRAEALGEGGADVLAEGMVGTLDAVATHFPENLFWDFDHLAEAAVTAAERHGGVDRLTLTFERLVALQSLFGRDGPIRFRYVHDFLYGYDWAKWVRRDPGPRRHVGPFDVVFLERMLRRGQELLGLIDEDDATYPRLTDARHRNPFPFSREPKDEAALLTALALERLIPVETWRPGALPRWDRAFADERTRTAQELFGAVG